MKDPLEKLVERLTQMELRLLTAEDFRSHEVLDRVRAAEVKLSDSQCESFELSASLLEAVDFSNCRWAKTVLQEVHAQRCPATNAWFCDSRWQDVVWEKSRLTGVNLAGTRLDSVRFCGSKLDLMIAHECSLQDVWFEKCDLKEADFQNANLRRVTFRECDLRSARFPAARIEDVDWRGSHLAGMSLDAMNLKRGVVDPAQVLDFARLLGLEVKPLDGEKGD